MIVTKAMRATIKDRRALTVLVDGKQMPGSVPFLKELLSATTDPFDRDELLVELAGEYLRAELEDEHLQVMRERVGYLPEVPLMWLGLAGSLSRREDGAPEAKLALAKGVALARSEDKLVRYALVSQADVARQLGDGALFEDALRALILDLPNDREDDWVPNDQFLADLPPGFCSADLEIECRRLLAASRPEE